MKCIISWTLCLMQLKYLLVVISHNTLQLVSSLDIMTNPTMKKHNNILWHHIPIHFFIYNVMFFNSHLLMTNGVGWVGGGGHPPHCSCHFNSQLVITNGGEWAGDRGYSGPYIHHDRGRVGRVRVLILIAHVTNSGWPFGGGVGGGPPPPHCSSYQLWMTNLPFVIVFM